MLPALAADSHSTSRHRPAVQRAAADDDGRGRLAETHANRRTDYAMVSELDGDLANLPD